MDAFQTVITPLASPQYRQDQYQPPPHQTGSPEFIVKKVEPKPELLFSKGTERYAGTTMAEEYPAFRGVSPLAVMGEDTRVSGTSKARKRPGSESEEATPVAQKVSKLSVDNILHKTTQLNFANKHPKDEHEAIERNKLLGYLDGRLNKANHGPLIVEGNSLCDFCSDIDESIKVVSKYLKGLKDFRNIKDNKGNVIGLGFCEYSNTQEKHNSGLQYKSISRFSTPEHLQKLQEKDGFLSIFSGIRKLHPNLDILMVDVLRQDFRGGGNGATDYSWHQDTAPLDNPEGLDIKRTFILKLTEGESAMQIAGKPITNYGKDAGSWIDFHAGAYHRSIVIEGTCHLKIVCFLGQIPDSDVTSGYPRDFATHALAPSAQSSVLSGDGERFALYQQYKRYDVQRLSGHKGKPSSWREGVKRVDRDYYLFVNLRKDKGVSARLQYNDYFEDSGTFHWQSQNQTSHHSPVGQRFINHKRDDYRINLFVRKQVKERGVTLPFMYMGKVDFYSSVGSKPMNIIWKLQNAVPSNILKDLAE